MKIERVELQGFRSFRDLQVFEFSRTPGVVKLSGRNDDEPSLGANGAGKSSFWEGVYWVLTGKTSVGLKGPEVCTWNQGRGVYGLVRIGGRALVRTWGTKNTLMLDGEEGVSQDDVDAWLGLSAEQLLHCAYMAQHARAFLDLSAPEKTDLLASVIRLDSWAALSDTARTTRNTVRQDREAVEHAIAHAEGRLRELRSTDYEALVREWRSRKADDITACEENIQRRASAVKDAEARFSKKPWEDPLLTKELEVAEATRDTHATEMASIEARIAGLREKRRAVRAGDCPTCGRPFENTHRHAPTTADIAKELMSAEEDVTRCHEALVPARRAVEALVNRQHALSRLKDDLTREVEDARDRHAAAVDRLSAARSEANPYADLTARKETQQRGVQAQLASLKDELDLLLAHEARVEFWVSGFKDVRLFLVTEALAQLELEVNACLQQLGLHGWEVRFAPDRETKAGATRRGFSVLITSPSNPRPVPWSAWSGGEAQRLRVATSMGLSNLITAYTGFSPFVEVWDEPSTGMSVEGIQGLLQAFADRARLFNRQVWVVDHRALESGVFSQTVLAVKSSGTSKLEIVDNGQGE